jgi:hypothetical protein
MSLPEELQDGRKKVITKFIEKMTKVNASKDVQKDLII